ncbi:MAG: poly-gamma-glutamate system protein [Candidatus Tenebribacter davisii]|jgi:poly-gamma-glutamate system protein|nr:poly-gamma-glutamate system protein [Candidatus Tenebribacter davisii]
MFIPSAKSKFSLISLMLIALALFIRVENSRVFVSDEYYEEKLMAAKLMQEAESAIKDYRNDLGIYIDEVNDPNRTAMIGDKQSPIVTDRGDLTSKLTSLNPNFAAVIVEMFKEANLKKGDKIAISCTGSFPALNIAVLSAAKVMGLDPIIISSIGASMFGATDPDFTWLDMEEFFIQKNIFNYKSVATSIGGGRDLGRGLSKNGRELIIKNINKHNIQLVHGETLEQNIAKKMEIYNTISNNEIALYVNIGGGLSSIGATLNGRLITPGFHRYLSLSNPPIKGTMLLFADEGIPIIHLLDITRLAESKDLPIAPDPLPKPGNGNMFEDEKYNLTIATISFVILLFLILMVIFFDHRELKIKDDEINV